MSGPRLLPIPLQTTPRRPAKVIAGRRDPKLHPHVGAPLGRAHLLRGLGLARSPYARRRTGEMLTATACGAPGGNGHTDTRWNASAPVMGGALVYGAAAQGPNATKRPRAARQGFPLESIGAQPVGRCALGSRVSTLPQCEVPLSCWRKTGSGCPGVVTLVCWGGEITRDEEHPRACRVPPLWRHPVVGAWEGRSPGGAYRRARRPRAGQTLPPAWGKPHGCQRSGVTCLMDRSAPVTRRVRPVAARLGPVNTSVGWAAHGQCGHSPPRPVPRYMPFASSLGRAAQTRLIRKIPVCSPVVPDFTAIVICS